MEAFHPRQVLGSDWNIHNVENMLLQIAATRCVGVRFKRMILMASVCFHPSNTGQPNALR